MEAEDSSFPKMMLSTVALFADVLPSAAGCGSKMKMKGEGRAARHILRAHTEEGWGIYCGGAQVSFSLGIGTNLS